MPSKPIQAFQNTFLKTRHLEKAAKLLTAHGAPSCRPLQTRRGKQGTMSDAWETAVKSNDAVTLAELVLLSSASPEAALAIVRSCAALLEKEQAPSTTSESLNLSHVALVLLPCRVGSIGWIGRGVGYLSCGSWRGGWLAELRRLRFGRSCSRHNAPWSRTWYCCTVQDT